MRARNWIGGITDEVCGNNCQNRQRLFGMPGCIAAGDTFTETAELIQQAAIYHVEMMAEDGETIPEPTCTAIEVDVPLPATPEEIAVETGR